MWSNEAISEFLSLYEQEAIIWNPKHDEHKDRNAVHDAWKRIQHEFSITCTISELKKKKESLMGTFRKLNTKVKATMKTGSSADDVFKPDWFAYEQMAKFLQSIYTPRETKSSDPLESETVMPPPSTSAIQPSDQMITLPSARNNEKKFNTPTRTNAIKKRPISTDLCLDEAQKKINESFETLIQALKAKKVEEDECDIYAKLLAKRLRKYPERLRDKIMYKIDGFLLENPYPDERPTSAEYYSSTAPSPYYQHSTPSPANDVPYVEPEMKEIQHIPFHAQCQETGLNVNDVYKIET